MNVKICGITNLPDAISAALLGADYLGFLVEIGFSPDSISRKEAKEIIARLPLEVKPVYVTYEKKAEKIIKIAEEIKPMLVQLHNDITVKEILKIRKKLPEIKIIKAISVVGEKSIKEAKEYMEHVDYLLLDTKVKGKKGGTGKTHDWSISKKIADLGKPVFLAGGLNPENVTAAVKIVKPFAADTNSGVKEKDRKKDQDKIKRFIEGAK